MATYFYDYSVNATIARDPIGTVCRNDEAAIRYGWSKLSTLISQHEPTLRRQHFELIIRREDGVNVGRMSMTVDAEAQNPATAAALASKQRRLPNGPSNDKLP